MHPDTHGCIVVRAVCGRRQYRSASSSAGSVAESRADTVASSYSISVAVAGTDAQSDANTDAEPHAIAVSIADAVAVTRPRSFSIAIAGAFSERCVEHQVLVLVYRQGHLADSPHLLPGNG